MMLWWLALPACTGRKTGLCPCAEQTQKARCEVKTVVNEDDIYMESLRLSVAVGEYDRTSPLLSGAVPLDGINPVFMALEPEEIFFRAFLHADFDICELSLSSYVLQTSKGECPYIGIPAFPSRAFRHTSIYVRKDRIAQPEDLIGKRIGIPEYQLTANVWARALLEDDYGVKPSDVIWVQGGVEEPSRTEKLGLHLPQDVRIEPAPPGRSLSTLLEVGEIDAIIAPRAPSCFDRNVDNVGWLFPDPMATAGDYFKRTGVFPIMHIVGIRRDVVERHPFVPMAVFKAFNRARSIAVKRLYDAAALRVSLPFLESNVRAARDIMGENFWPYGVQENRVVLETFLKHHQRQGLTSRLLTVEEMFHPSTFEAAKI